MKMRFQHDGVNFKPWPAQRWCNPHSTHRSFDPSPIPGSPISVKYCGIDIVDIDIDIVDIDPSRIPGSPYYQSIVVIFTSWILTLPQVRDSVLSEQWKSDARGQMWCSQSQSTGFQDFSGFSPEVRKLWKVLNKARHVFNFRKCYEPSWALILYHPPLFYVSWQGSLSHSR